MRIFISLPLTDQLPTEAASASTSPMQCQTKLGRALEKVLGPSDEVNRFDKARTRLKNHPSHKDKQENYCDQLALMETRISREMRKTKEQLKTWEQQHFSNCSELPSYQDMLSNATVKLLLDKIKHSKAIFNEFRK